MSSKQRLLSAITGRTGNSVPCSFMMFRALRDKCRDEYEFVERQMALGLDARVELDDLPIRFSPDVTIREAVSTNSADGTSLLTRHYDTPKGTLTSTIKQIDGWPFGDRLPLFSDYITPRAVIYPVTKRDNLAALEYLLQPPLKDDIASFLQEASRRKRFANKHGLLLCGGWRGSRAVPGEDPLLIGRQFGTISVIDTLMWLCGATAPLMWAYDAPDFLHELIELLATWNHHRLQFHLDAGVDLVFRRAWYEGTEFWSPKLYREFIMPALQKEVALAHQAGTKYGYIISSGLLPIADLVVEAGVDVIVGIDPEQGKGTDLDSVKRVLGGRIGLWGGVSGPLVVEEGSEQEVFVAVERALATLANTNRFILSPVDNIRSDTPNTWRNIEVFIQAWRQLTQER